MFCHNTWGNLSIFLNCLPLFQSVSRCFFSDDIVKNNPNLTNLTHQSQVEIQTFCSDPESFTDGRRAPRFLLTPADQPDCSSYLEVTSIIGCFCSVLSTADWSWRGNVLYFMNVTLQRGEREPEPEPESLLSAEFSQSWLDSNQTLSYNILTVWGELNNRMSNTKKRDWFLTVITLCARCSQRRFTFFQMYSRYSPSASCFPRLHVVLTGKSTYVPALFNAAVQQHQIWL